MKQKIDTTLVDKAIRFATQAHQGAERKGRGVPYIVHPMECVSIVSMCSRDQDLMAAAALHDVVEDTDVTIDDIRREFGDRVASLVADETVKAEEGEDKHASWRRRKQQVLDHLTTAPRESKIVAMADKLSNLRTMYYDYLFIGDQLWQRFNTHDPRDHEWYYRGLAGALSDLAGTPPYVEFTTLLSNLFGDPTPQLIDMREWEESGDGYTAISYNHRDGRRMMKLYAPFIPREDILDELTRAWNVASLGITTPWAYRLVTDGERTGIEFQRIVGKESFARAISRRPHELEHYARLFAQECLRLHHLSCCRQIFGTATDTAIRNVAMSTALTAQQRDTVLAWLRQLPVQHTCLHGDLHIGNIITDGTLNYWIDLEDFTTGMPLFDLGSIYLQTCLLPPDLILHLYHIPADQARAVWHIVVDTYFQGRYTVQEVEQAVRPFAALVLIKFASRRSLEAPLQDFLQQALASDAFHHLPILSIP